MPIAELRRKIDVTRDSGNRRAPSRPPIPRADATWAWVGDAPSTAPELDQIEKLLRELPTNDCTAGHAKKHPRRPPGRSKPKP